MKVNTCDSQEDILEILAEANNYNEWLVSKFERYLGKNILEIGAGIGNITVQIEKKGFKITPTDVNNYFLRTLKRINKDAFHLNILDFNRQIKSEFDTIIALNVLEHIKDDIRAFKNIYDLLPQKGTCIILVPAHNLLFGSYDKSVGHYRRYSRESLSEKLSSVGFVVENIKYYNKLSALGWFMNAKIFNKKKFPQFQLSILRLLVPFLDLFDKVIPFNFGISIICAARKG